MISNLANNTDNLSSGDKYHEDKLIQKLDLCTLATQLNLYETG